MAAEGPEAIPPDGVRQSPVQPPAKKKSGSDEQPCNADQLRKGTAHNSALVCRSLVETTPEGIGATDSNARTEDALEETGKSFRDLYENAPNAYFSVGVDGVIRGCNRRAGELLGYSVEELVGRPALDLYADTVHGKEKAAQVLDRFQAGDTVRDEELEMQRADGTPVWISLTVDAARDSGGKVVESRSMVVDITERKQAERERLVHLQFLESMDRVNRAIQGADDLDQMMSDVLDVVLSVLDCDRASLVYPCDPEAQTWTAPMERFRPPHKGVLALGLQVPMDDEVAFCHRLLRSSDSPVPFGQEHENRMPDGVGERFQIRSQLGMALYPKDDRPWMFVIHQCSHSRRWQEGDIRLFQEIGRRLTDGLTGLLMLRKLRKVASGLAEAQRIAGIGNWEWDIANNSLWWSDETFRIFGVKREEFGATIEAFLNAVHADDRERVKSSIGQALQGDLGRWQIDYRIACADGTLRFVHEEAETLSDPEGKPIRRVGTVQDITERKRVEEALRKSEQRFEQVAANARGWIWETDTDGRYTYASSAVGAILGYTPEEIVGVKHFYDLFHPEDREEAKRAAFQAFAEKRAFREFPNRNVHKAGMEIWLSTSGIPVLDEEGGLLGYRGVDTDITELKRAEQERQAHLHFFECMDRVNRAMLGTNDLDQMMRDVLDVVLSVFHCDRTFLMYPCDPEAATWRVPMERTKPEYPGVLDLGLEMPMDSDVAQSLRLVLASEGPLKVGPGTPHPLPADVADRFNLKSYMSMAVYPKEGKPWQFGIHQCSHARIWTKDEESLFQEVGRRLTDALSSLLMLRNLRESEERFRSLVTQAADAFYLIDQDGRILDVNQSACDYLGYTREGLLELNIADVDVEVEDRRHKERFWDSLRPGEAATFEGSHRRKDGSTFPVEVRLGALELGGRRLMLGLARDITERKKSEQERQAHLRFFECMDRINQAMLGADDLDQMMSDVLDVVLSAFDCDRAALVYPCDPHSPTWRVPMERTKPKCPRAVAQGVDMPMTTPFANTAETLLASVGPVTFGPGNDLPLPPDEQHFAFQSVINLVLYPKVGLPWEFVMHQCSHARVWSLEERRLFQAIGRRLSDALASLVSHRDLQRSEERLRESEERLRLTLEGAQIGIFDWDVEHDTWFVSPEYYTMLGYEPKRGLGDRTEWLERVHPDDRHHVAAEIQEVLARTSSADQPQTYEYEARMLHADGTYRWHCVKQVAIERDRQGRVTRMLGLRMDIHDRKIAEEERRNAERQLRTIVENFPDYLTRLDEQCRHLYVNPAVEKGVGMSLEHCIGKTLLDLSAPGPPGQNEMLCASVRQAFEQRIPNKVEAVWPSRQGERIFEVRHIPELDDDDEVVSVLRVTRDITEQRQAEEHVRRLNLELERRVADRTAELEATNQELEAFAYSVSHDLRAPLRHIDGFVDLLRKRATENLGPKSQHYMDMISDSAGRMGGLIDDLLSFSRTGRREMRKVPCDLGDLFQEAVRELEPEAEGRSIRWHVADLPAVTGDPAMLRLVLVNLVSNALKFTRPRQQAEIEIGCLPSDETEIVVFVRDNGVGFDPDYAGKLFGVFQRLHGADEFEGTGIGLANVRRIVNRHGGRTWAEGAVDRGAIFFFSLPQIPRET